MRHRAHRFAGLAVASLLWCWLFFHLHYEWMLNAQYNYGWAVPFLAGLMFYLRWPARPPAQPLSSSWLTVAAWALLALLLPIRMIEEANPDWRLLSWIFAWVVVAYSFLMLLQSGGVGWARQFAFPLCFPLVAVPWLVQIENSIIQGMTRAVAFAAVEIAGWIGVGAYQIGNIIELHNGFVGVDEACSGVKTLQASIMVALVLGELFQLRPARRVGLLVAGAAWVFLCNVLRATTLVIIAAKQGTGALTSWHDPVGIAVLIGGMAGLVALGWLMREKEPPPHAPRNVQQNTSPGLALYGGWAPHALAIVWLIGIFVATEAWYRSHERELVDVPAWEPRWPTDEPTFRLMPIAETTRAILRYDEASSAAWEEPRTVRWWSFFAYWRPQRTALQLVRSHSPEICLPAAGRTFVQERPAILVDTEVLPLRFRVYEFEQRDRPLFVFVCIQEDKASQSRGAPESNDWNTRSRLLTVWKGQRNLGQRLLEIAVTGFDDFLRAREAFAATIVTLVEKKG